MTSTFPPLRAGDAVTEPRLVRILNGVRTRRLPKQEWTHGAHLVLAAALIDETGLEGAEKAAPGHIRAYNEATGVVNDDKNGYHETLTLFFLRRVARFLDACPEPGLAEKTTRLLASPLAAADYPLGFYSKAHLFSVAARRGWLAPDLKPMDADD